MSDEQKQSIQDVVNGALSEYNDADTSHDDGTATEEIVDTSHEENADTSNDSKGDDSGSQDAEFTGNFENDVPQEFHKHPRWKQIHAKGKEADALKSERDQLRAELEEFKRQSSIESISDEDLYSLAQKRGLSVNQEQQPANKAEQKGTDDLFDLSNATPEQRQLHEYVMKVAQEAIKPYEQKLKQYEDEFSQSKQQQYLSKVKANEQQAAKWVKDTFNVDYQKQVLPELKLMFKEKIDQNPQWGVGLMPMDLVKLWAGEKGLDISKRIGIAEQQRLNEEKRKKQVEAEQGMPTGKEIDYSKMNSISDVVRTAYKEGRAKFG